MPRSLEMVDRKKSIQEESEYEEEPNSSFSLRKSSAPLPSSLGSDETSRDDETSSSISITVSGLSGTEQSRGVSDIEEKNSSGCAAVVVVVEEEGEEKQR